MANDSASGETDVDWKLNMNKRGRALAANN